MSRALMLQGTGSDVGKSVLVAGLCRAARRRGIRVWPFKPQNMSNNAAVAADGGEIGRAQWLQALACGVAPSVHMNPVLLKPESDREAQVIVQGHVRGRFAAQGYMDGRDSLMGAVLQSFAIAESRADLVIVEGAGSPAEINLRARDIANMGFARAADVPVVLIGDIDRGGVIASLVGTHAVLDPADRAMVRGFLINKFRGDPALFTDGLLAISRETGWRSFGMLPWIREARQLPAEDAVVLEAAANAGPGGLKIAVPLLPHIANFDDLDPLRAEEGVSVTIVPPGQPLPRDAGLVILPGSKATIADLQALRAEGWDIDILAHLRHGGAVLGLCGGYQMLGRMIHDPDGIEGVAGSVPGLGLLDVETVMEREKILRLIPGHGYEIHMGRTYGADCAKPFLTPDGEPHGATRPDGLVAGCYLHGLFDADDVRRRYLGTLGHAAGREMRYRQWVEDALDRIADVMEAALDIDGLLALARRP